MKILRFLLIGIIAFSAVRCGTKQSALQQGKLVNKLIEKDTFEIQAQWAMPLNANLIGQIGLLPPGSAPGNISLQGNGNYFRKMGDSLSIYLPYFGERQLAGNIYGSNNSSGIVFNGKPESNKYKFNSRKKSHEYIFEITNQTESFRVLLIIYENLSTRTTINSSHRTTISYTGNIERKEK